MNRKPKSSSSKYSFEPKIPQNQDIVEVEVSPTVIETEFVPKNTGCKYPPNPVESSMSEIPFIFSKQDGCLFSLPADIGNAKLVVYEDGSNGLRIGDRIFPLSTRFIGDSSAVEHGSSAYRIGGAKFQLSPRIPNEQHEPE